MNAGSYIHADCLDEVAETFIGRMLAPKDCGPDVFTCLRRSWWQTGIYSGLVCGMVIGLLAFLSIPGSGREPGVMAVRAVVPLSCNPSFWRKRTRSRPSAKTFPAGSDA